jgi:quercetin dioxygenase-like cupin family protein
MASPAKSLTRLEAKSLNEPDEVRPFEGGKGRVEVVNLTGGAVGLGTFEPGWRWSQHVKPIAGTDSCQVPHVGYVLKGRMTVHGDDGSEVELTAGDAVLIPPGHDAWTVGDEACVMVDFGGLEGYAKR